MDNAVCTIPGSKPEWKAAWVFRTILSSSAIQELWRLESYATASIAGSVSSQAPVAATVATAAEEEEEEEVEEVPVRRG